MKTLKISVVLALSLIMSLICLVTTSENPLDVKYKAVISELQDAGSISHEKEILERFQDLKLLRQKIEELKKLECAIAHATSGPSPSRSKEEYEKLKAEITNFRIMKEEIFIELDRFISDSALARLEQD